MLRAMWNGQVLAEAARTVRVEGNHYFPPDSLHREFFRDSSTRSVCPWKGMAGYYTVEVDGVSNPDAAWFYARPSPLARRIKGHVAFRKGVEIVGEQEQDDDTSGIGARHTVRGLFRRGEGRP